MKFKRWQFPIALAVTGLWLIALSSACTSEKAPPPQTKPPAPAAAPEQPAPAPSPHDAEPVTTEGTVPAAKPVPAKVVPPDKTQQGTPAQPTPEPAGAAPAPEPAPPQEPSAGPVPAPPESAPPESGSRTHAAVGSEKCKMCHRIQYESWSASKHAKATPPLGCETCHGNGADYGKISVMKDPALAKAAGLVLPGKDFCTSKCHKPTSFTDDMLQKTHAHKVK